MFPGSPSLPFLALSVSTSVSNTDTFSSPQGQLCNAPTEPGSHIFVSIESVTNAQGTDSITVAAYTFPPAA